MKKTLDDLSGMEGINGAFLCSEDGDLVAYSAPDFYDNEILSQASSIAARAADSMSVEHSEWETIVCHFADGKLLLIRLDSHILCVLADSKLNLPFVNVAIRVAKKKLQKKIETGQDSQLGSSMMASSGVVSGGARFDGDSQIRSTAHGGASESSIHGQSSMSAALERQTGSFFSEDSGSGMYWSGMGGSGMQSSAVIVADEAASQLLTKVGNAMAGAVGPMAKVFVKESVRRICPSVPFSTRHLRALMADLEQQISDRDELKEFQDKVYR